ncbi:SRPBCC family protein [Actinomadura barringtoniae]|uniref:SRPBCC family protein n=1 Tax=Actinomadura barringtoniae TaxID=1427535 RepID=A0A939P6C1_9ACTN|nr:SRPBCC family protein [Actinomadura barringtoniae]MBO2446143.1 SRPBCC family protein [Actinomadura barringtoniae]
MSIEPIQDKVTVNAPVERAFGVFTAKLGDWWPAQYHIGEAEMATAVLEPKAGGRWYERGVDGSECDWGRVLAWEPSGRLVITWQINGMWQFDPDPEHASEIEIRFTADGPGRTTVEMEHSALDRLVGGESIRETIGGAGGWTSVLENYVKVVENEPK